MNATNNDFKSKTKRNTIQLAIWTWSWVLSMALAAFGPKFLWDQNKGLTLAAILLNLAMGFMMIRANMKFLNGLDELQRKIQIDAMAISLGVGIVGGLAYSLLDTTNLIPWDAEISLLVVIISVTYMVSLLVNQKRYL
ncbi:hypothetical protein E7Z59_02265 [Robertkochia marina]|uniref:Uncharacterized protein n=1 Tax=Robertkochia marina TaxID=1227945 RepID=A0A4S3M292_9FLAO|nr:hypothetical protein [Robertkochia marina]THD69176.1 hypothetical protein E7Z59_02265 [Robertkochia marina]TRZ47566.1 hypothetical protein D3A96_02335 [Robertkochia marina]